MKRQTGKAGAGGLLQEKSRLVEANLTGQHVQLLMSPRRITEYLNIGELNIDVA